MRDLDHDHPSDGDPLRQPVEAVLQGAGHSFASAQIITNRVSGRRSPCSAWRRAILRFAALASGAMMKHGHEESESVVRGRSVGLGGRRARLLALANALDGLSREQAARLAGITGQTLGGWVHLSRFPAAL